MFEEMEERVTRGRGVGSEVIRAARERVTRARVEVIEWVAAALVGRREPELAVPWLEEAVGLMPERGGAGGEGGGVAGVDGARSAGVEAALQMSEDEAHRGYQELGAARV